MALKKNTAVTGFTVNLVSASDGSDVTTGTPVGYYKLPGGSQLAIADTTPVHEGNGQWTFDLTAAEMNGDVVGLVFTHTSAVTASFTITTETKLVSELVDLTSAIVTDAVWDEDIVASHNAPDSAGRILSNTSNLANGSGGISVAMDTFTKTQGGTETNTESVTTELNGTVHIIPANGTPEIDVEYEFLIGTTGAATEVVWNGYVTANNDNAEVYGWDFISASYKQVGTISGGSANITEHTFLFQTGMTGFGADAGKVRFRIASVGADVATVVATDRVLCEFTALPEAGSILHSGVAVSATTNTIVLDASASTADEFYNHTKIVISSGLGSEQERLLVHYDGATRTAKVAPPWVVIPDSTSAFEVEPALAHAETGWATIKVGLAAAATSTTITLDSDASSVDDYYNNDLVHIDNGTGEGQRAVIVDYVGSTKIATVYTSWITTPDTTSEYIIEEGHPYTDVASSSLSTQIADKTGYELSATGLDTIASTSTGMVEISKAVWDRVLTGGTHNIPTSAGRRVRDVIDSVVITSDTAQAGTTNTITLATGASAVDGTYDPAQVAIVGGTGIGQTRLILGYVGSTRVAVVDRNWKINPDATSIYTITSNTGREHVNEGLAQAATSTTITLNTLASASNDTYKGQIVFVRSGTGDDQARLVIGYVGATKVATLDKAWSITPDATSGYVMMPSSPVELSVLTQASIDSIETAVDTTIPAQITALPNDVLTTALAEVYAADGVAPTVQQALMLIQQTIGDFAISGTTMTVKKLDGSTTAATYTLDDAGNPTSRTRTT